MSTLSTIGLHLTVRLAPQVFRAFHRELLSINDTHDTRFQERPVSKEALVNAIIIDYLQLPLNERREIIETSLRTLENYLIDPQPPQEQLDIGRLDAKGTVPTKRKPKKKN
jgi:hypothetical protein